MPTAARIISAVCLAFIAWVVSGLIKVQLSAVPDFGLFVPLCVVIAALSGWSVLGRRADRGRLGLGNALGVGLSASLVTCFWVLLLVSGYDSFQVAMDRTFHDPMKVIYNIYPIARDYVMDAMTTTIALWLFGGGAITGVLAHMAGKKWPGR